MPYTLELNDIPNFLQLHHTGQQFYETIRDQFDVLYADGEATGRVMAISLHPMITGQPHRAKYLDQALAYVTVHRHVWLATGPRYSTPTWARRVGCGDLTPPAPLPSEGKAEPVHRAWMEPDDSSPQPPFPQKGTGGFPWQAGTSTPLPQPFPIRGEGFLVALSMTEPNTLGGCGVSLRRP